MGPDFDKKEPRDTVYAGAARPTVWREVAKQGTLYTHQACRERPCRLAARDAILSL
jgi:hypothetical protein